MGRLIYRDLVALIELQNDVRAGEYAADRPREDPPMTGGSRVLCVSCTNNGQPKQGQPFP